MLGTLQDANPRDTVAARHVRELFVEEHFAHVDDAILRDEKDAVALRVRGAEVQDLDFLAAEIERHAIAVGRARHARPLHVGRHVATLHLIDQAGTVVLVRDLEDIRVDGAAAVEGIVEG